MRNKKTQELVLLAILTALSLVLAFVYVPTATGFVTLLDVGVYFTAFYLGKKEGAIVGGLAGLLIDFLLGYPQWAFFLPFVKSIKVFDEKYFEFNSQNK
ncbi:ECF transporter S component [Streptococcus suis]|nr:ECF transporter S component [Streptococcus suis]HEM4316543.1 ECF transporter S component [Streptococcus suis]